MSSAETDHLQRDVDVAWELFDVQPTHPEIGRLAGRVLAQQPGRNGTRMLLAMHRQECGATDEARDLLLQVVGSRDRFFVNAARELRDLEQRECRHVEARRWADTVLREDQERWDDRMELGVATAMTGDLEVGWQILDDAVAQCGHTAAEELPHALAARAIYLFQSFAPSARFIAAAEEAVRADPTSEIAGAPLIWAYVHQGRFDDAEELSRRMLRLDPTDLLAHDAVTMIREMRAAVDKEGLTLADVHASGIVDALWTRMRDQILGTDLVSALTALEGVMPVELRAALRPGLDEEAARASPGEREIAAWHDGQEPGTGALWGVEGDFRLMSSTEISAMDDAIEADAEAWVDWQQEGLEDYYSQVMTDDRGAYLFLTAQDTVVRRRRGDDDVVVAPNLAAWFWDRVTAFGGRDPRPARVPQG